MYDLYSPCCQRFDALVDILQLKSQILDSAAEREGFGGGLNELCVGGGMRRKRHHTLSKIIERLGVEPQVVQHHVQPGFRRVWASSAAQSTTCMIAIDFSKVSMICDVARGKLE